MKHKKPEQRAALWLAVNAGSVLEDDDQRGLAHFVEHMAFNGTKRFPKQAIVDYSRRSACRSAPTSTRTRRSTRPSTSSQVPTDDSRELLDNGLDILREWAGDVTFDPDRGRQGARRRPRGVAARPRRVRAHRRQAVRSSSRASKYGARLPIGEPEILKTAKRDTLVRFYKDWYRPDLMAVIAVGDFDPADDGEGDQGAVRRHDRPGRARARAPRCRCPARSRHAASRSRPIRRCRTRR